MKMQPVPVIPCRGEATARVDVVQRASAPTARGSVGALMHGQSLPERGHARMPGSLATAVGSSSISHPSITEPPSQSN